MLNNRLFEEQFSVFEKINQTLNKYEGKTYKLHQGKTIFSPSLDWESWNESGFGLAPFEHASPAGHKKLLAAIEQKLDIVSGYEVLITAGATHALSSIFNLLLNPSDEVIVLAPNWLFINGVIKLAYGCPVECDLFMQLSFEDESIDIGGYIKTFITCKTKCIYLNTPNNPTGYSLNDAQLKEIINTCSEFGLYLIFDNAYDEYDLEYRQSIPNRLGLQENVFHVHTFSKMFAMPGLRIGYLQTPAKYYNELRKYILYSVYSISTVSQFFAMKEIENGKLTASIYEYVRETKPLLKHLDIPHSKVEGGFYTLLDLSGLSVTADQFIDQCLAKGLSLAPGVSFGKCAKNYARLCFTSVSRTDLKEAISVLNQTYEKTKYRD